MKKYDGVVAKELIKHKKRTIFTLLSIIFSLGMLILIGEINNLNHKTKLISAKVQTGDMHGKLSNISGSDGVKLQNNSLIEEIGYSYKEIYIVEENEGYSKTMEEIFYGDIKYFTKILMKEGYELEGRFPLNKNEVIIADGKSEKEKIGSKTIVGGKEKIIVGHMKLNDEASMTYKILGIENVENLQKVNASIKLTENKNMVENIKSIGKGIGIDEVIDKKIATEIPKDKAFIDLNVDVITELGEEVKIGETIVYPNKAGQILQGILIVVLAMLVYISINASIKEKKKIYSMLKCIGASNGQIRSLILKEGIIVAILAIVPGIILGEVIFSIIRESLLEVINKLNLEIKYSMNMEILITSVFLVFVIILLASLIPMIWVSKLAPMEGIREERIKGNKKRIRSKFIRKVFGYEGEIAYKNLRADKANLVGITLTMMIFLIIFNVFTSYYKFTIKEAKESLGVMTRDLEIIEGDKESEEILLKYRDYGEYSKVNMHTQILRIEGIDNEIIKDSQSYKYYDEEKNIIISRSLGSSIVEINDKAFKDLSPYINGGNITLEEEFKKDGVIFFSNEDEGAIHPPKDKDRVRVYINNSENLGKFKNFWSNNNEIGKFVIPEGEETLIKDLNIIGTVYLETLLGPRHTIHGRFNGIIISESLAKKLKLNSVMDSKYIFEFNNKENREKYIEKLEKELEEKGGSFNTAQVLKEKTEYLKALANIIYIILAFMIIMIILSIVNIRDIVLNNRKKEFGIMFAVGMDKKMLRKSLIYEGVIQGIVALTIGNLISFGIFNIIQMTEKKFVYSNWIMVISSVVIIIITILNTLNAIRQLSSDKPMEMIKNIE